MLHVGQNEDITYNPKHNNLTRKHGVGGIMLL